MIRWLIVPLFLGACSASLEPALRRPDGGYHLKCGAQLERCVTRAEDLCKGRGYVVISGMSKHKLYGAELGVSQVEERQAELDIACADKRGDLPTVTAGSSEPPSAPPPVSTYAPVVTPPSLAPAAPSAAPPSAAPPSAAPPSATPPSASAAAGAVPAAPATH